MTVKIKELKKKLAQSALTNTNRVHITPREKGWAVRKEGSLVASTVFNTQKEAISLAKEWVTSGDATAVIVHAQNGSFRTAR